MYIYIAWGWIATKAETRSSYIVVQDLWPKAYISYLPKYS